MSRWPKSSRLRPFRSGPGPPPTTAEYGPATIVLRPSAMVSVLKNVRQCRAVYRVLHASIHHDVLSDSLWTPAHGGEVVICSTTAAVFSRQAERSRHMRQFRLLSS